jgi:cyclopropane fatty-acyl-phospholipid synthase-like methyltransferase
MALIVFVLGFLVGLALLKAGSTIQSRLAFLNDPVYVPSTNQAIQTMLVLAKAKAGDTVIDFGSGDGRVVTAFAQQGCLAIGYEVNPILVWRSRRLIQQAKLIDRAHIYLASFWQADVSTADTVILYTTAGIMDRLAQKLKRELKPSAQIISQRFTFPHSKPYRQSGEFFVYRVKDLHNQVQE